MPTINFEQLQQAAQQRKAQEEAQLAELGYRKIGNKYYKAKTPTEDLSEQLTLQSKAQDLNSQGVQDQIRALELQLKQKELEKANTAPAQELLSVDEAAKLSLPYGTTRADAAAKNVTPRNGQDKPNEQQLAYSSIKSLIPEIKISSDGKIRGVGTGFSGSLGGILYGLGLAKDDEAETNRIAIGQIKATLGKLRGGTSFTANEEKLLNSYTPNINDSDARIRTKLKSLNKYVDELDRKYNFTGGTANTQASGAQSSSGFKVLNVKPVGQ